MKNHIYIFLIVMLFGITSCEDVVEVDLGTAPARLVVEASLDWYKGEQGNFQKIKLMTTTGYYEQSIPVVSGAIVFVENEDGLVFDFIEEENSGEYFCYDFIPELGGTYTLNLVINGEVYTATEVLKEVPEILYAEQTNMDVFGEKFIELKYFFQDDPEQDNFYMSYLFSSNLRPLYGIYNDEFFQGNIMYGLFFLDEVSPGDQVSIRLYGISQRYHNYMNKLIEAADSGGGPFQSTPSTVRGNLVNQTNPDNYALGYFRLSEISMFQYTIE